MGQAVAVEIEVGEVGEVREPVGEFAEPVVVESKRGEVGEVGQAGREFAEAEVADRVAKHELMKKWCLRAGERQLVVPVEAEEPFRKALRSLGYGMPRV